MNITTWATVGSRPRKYESSSKPSLTVPNEAMSVRDMIRRNARNLPLMGNSKQAIFNGEDPIVPNNYDTLDLAEQDIIRGQVSDRFKVLKAKIDKQNLDDLKAKKAAHLKKLVDIELAKSRRDNQSKLDENSTK